MNTNIIHQTLNKIFYNLVAGITALLMPAGIVSATGDPPYHLSRIGLMSIRDNSASDQQIFGIVLGKRISFSYYVEAELNLPAASGKYDGDGGGAPRNYKMTNLAVYGVYRYVLQPELYLKLKLGLAYNRTSISGDNLSTNIVSENSSGAGGVGLGVVFRTNNRPIMLELEATTIDQSEVFLYSAGITYPF